MTLAIVHPHNLSDPLLIGQALGFGAGVVISIILLNLLRRSGAGQPGAQAKYLQVAFALMWDLGGLAGELGNLVGASTQTSWMRVAAMVNYSGAAFFPVSFLALWQRPRGEKSWRARLCYLLCCITVLSASGLTLAFMGHCLGICLPPHTNEEGFYVGHWLGKLLAWHVAGTLLAGTFLLWRGQLNNSAARFYAVMTVLGVATPAAIAIASMLFNLHERESYWAYLAEQQAPLLILLGAVVYFGDFRFSNVYVKSSLRFLTALLLALLASLLAFYTLPPLAARLAVFPRAAAVLSLTALLTALLCGFAQKAQKLNRWVDGWLFREPNYPEVTRQVWQELSQQDEDEAILALTAKLARETLALAEARVMPLTALNAGHWLAALNSGEVCRLPSHDELRQQLGHEFKFLAPIRVAGQVTHALALAPGAHRRSLLDSELNFLRGLAGQASSRLEALAAERERSAQQSKEERLLRQVTEAELRALRTQINPHFLFNSLNTIADLIVADPAKAERVTVQLARIFRHVLRGSDCQMATVNEELEFLRTWLDIEAVRFGDRLRVQFVVDDGLAAARVPSLILQPLVENALKHGLAPKLNGGLLQVSVRRAGERLQLMVEDDGLGFPCNPAALAATAENARGNGYSNDHRNGHSNGHSNGRGVGLRNVGERLATLYAGRAQMNCEAVATGGSRVTLLLPCEL